MTTIAWIAVGLAIAALAIGVVIGWALAVWDSRPPRVVGLDSMGVPPPRGCRVIHTTGLPAGYTPPSASLLPPDYDG